MSWPLHHARLLLKVRPGHLLHLCLRHHPNLDKNKKMKNRKKKKINQTLFSTTISMLSEANHFFGGQDTDACFLLLLFFPQQNSHFGQMSWMLVSALCRWGSSTFCNCQFNRSLAAVGVWNTFQSRWSRKEKNTSRWKCWHWENQDMFSLNCP